MTKETAVFSDEVQRQLNTPPEPWKIASRKANEFEGEKSIRYIPASVQMQDANRIFGAVSVRTLEGPVEKDTGDDEGVTAVAKMEVEVPALNGGTVKKQATGLCRAPGRSFESFQMALKGAETDGRSRALAMFGPALGLSLYTPDNIYPPAGEEYDVYRAFSSVPATPPPPANGGDGKEENANVVNLPEERRRRQTPPSDGTERIAEMLDYVRRAKIDEAYVRADYREKHGAELETVSDEQLRKFVAVFKEQAEKKEEEERRRDEEDSAQLEEERRRGEEVDRFEEERVKTLRAELLELVGRNRITGFVKRCGEKGYPEGWQKDSRYLQEVVDSVREAQNRPPKA